MKVGLGSKPRSESSSCRGRPSSSRSSGNCSGRGGGGQQQGGAHHARVDRRALRHTHAETFHRHATPHKPERGEFFLFSHVSHGNAAGNPRRVGARHGERAPALTAFLCCDENGSSTRLGLRETAREEERLAQPLLPPPIFVACCQRRRSRGFSGFRMALSAQVSGEFPQARHLLRPDKRYYPWG